MPAVKEKIFAALASYKKIGTVRHISEHTWLRRTALEKNGLEDVPLFIKIETFVWSVRTGYEKILHPVRIPVIWQRDAPQTDSKAVFTDILTIMKSKTVSLSRYMCR